MIEIKKIRLSELESFVQSDLYKQLSDKPISIQRVNSYINNPRGDMNDYVLFMAFENAELVGYRTILADKLFVGEKEYRFGWFSGNWVRSDKRRMGISTLIFDEVVKEWDGRLMFTNYAPESKAMYDKTSCFELLHEKQGARFYMRSPLSELLPPRSIFFKRVKFLLQVIDFIVNMLLGIRLLFRGRAFKDEVFSFEFVLGLDEELSNFIDRNKFKIGTNRQVKELEWIDNFPWVVKASSDHKMDDGYHFSSVSQYVERKYVKFFRSGELVGYMMLFLKDNKISIPYLFGSNFDLSLVLNIITEQVVEKKLSYLTIYHKSLMDELERNSRSFFFIKKMSQKYFITQSFKKELDLIDGVNFNDGDGDCVFA